MATDTTKAQQNGDVPTTKIRSVRIDDALWAAAQEAVKTEGEGITDVIRRALRAYIDDPAAFNLAVAQIRSRA